MSPTVKFLILILPPIRRLFNSNLMILTPHTTFHFHFCLSYTQLPPSTPFRSITVDSYVITPLTFCLIVTPLLVIAFNELRTTYGCYVVIVLAGRRIRLIYQHVFLTALENFNTPGML